MNYDQWKRERKQNEWVWDIQRFETYKRHIEQLQLLLKFAHSKEWAIIQISNYKEKMKEIKSKYPSHLKNEEC